MPLPSPQAPSASAETPASERSGDRKAQILRHAAIHFSREGYQATSMRQLADAVGIEAASLYSHFPSKEAILQTLAWTCADDFFATIEPITRSGLSTRPMLKAMLIAHIQVLLRNQDAATVFIDEWRHLSTPLRAEYAQLRDRYERLFREVIHRGIVENLFRGADAKYAALILLSALNGTARWYRPEGPLSPDETAALIADVLLEGLIRSV